MRHTRNALAPLSAVLILAVAACDGGGAREIESEGEGSLADGGLGMFDTGTDSPTPSIFDAGPADDEPPPGPRINSIVPNRGTWEGGTRLRIVGEQFVEGSRVLLGPLPCQEVVVESENHITCYTAPANPPGVVDVVVRWPEGDAEGVLPDGYTYFRPAVVGSMEPDRGPVRGGIEVEFTGEGFIEPTEVRFGPYRSTRVTIDEDGRRLVAVLPPGTPGSYDVRVTNLNGEAMLEDAFTYSEELLVRGLEPRWGWTTGDDEVRLLGAGLVEESDVRFDGRQSTVVAEELGRTRLVVRTPRGDAGTVTVDVENVNGEWRLDKAFLYVDPDATDFQLDGAAPTRIPTLGGTEIFIGGGGFDETVEIEVGGALAQCQVEAPQVLRCQAPPHERGVVDIVARKLVDGEIDEVELEDALTYYLPVEIFDIRPPRGSVSGGTVVEVLGRGFAEPVDLMLDGVPLLDVELIDDQRVVGRTPPSRSGLVTLTAETPDDRALLPEAYEYFDPTTRFGGVWGETIEGAVNVTVLNTFNAEPVVQAFVMLEDLEGNTRVSVTDEAGRVTISDIGLTGPYAITAAHPDYETATFERVTVENSTFYLYPFTPPSGGGGGGQERMASELMGTLSGIDALPKPLEEGQSLVAFVETTHSSPYNRRGLPWPEPRGILSEDGPFHIFCRPGELAIVATAAYVRTEALTAYQNGTVGYWDMREDITPIAMGVHRFISVSPGESVSNLDVIIDHRMDTDVAVTLDNPSGVVPGAPEIYEAWPFLDFGAEGYWELDPRAEGMTHLLTVPHLPDISDWDQDISYEWVGLARADNDFWEPYTLTFERTRDVAEGVTIGPFVGAPFPINPRAGGALDNRRTLEWGLYAGVEGPTEPPHAHLISITRADRTPVWTYVTPGAVTRVEVPALPQEVLNRDLPVQGDMEMTIIPFIIDGRFDYGEFTYDDLSTWKRKSYSVLTVPFTIGVQEID